MSCALHAKCDCPVKLYHCDTCNDWTFSTYIPVGVWHNDNCQGRYKVVR